MGGFSMKKQTIGELFKAALNEMGISQAEAARKIGVSSSTFSDFLNNRKSPSQSTILLYCEKLSIEYIQILKVK